MRELQKEIKSLKSYKNEQELLTKYIINQITDDIKIDNNNIKKEIDFEKYKNISNKHEKIINEWNKESNKLNKIILFIEKSNIINMVNINDEKNDDNDINTKLYNKYIECCSLIDIQTKRRGKATISTDYIREVMKYQNKLAVK